MTKRALPVNSKGNIIGYMIECPACGCGHLFYTNLSNPKCNWTFDGNLENPTFAPSMLVYPNRSGQKRCHSFVRDGNIQFLSDCEHHLKDQIVELPVILA